MTLVPQRKHWQNDSSGLLCKTFNAARQTGQSSSGRVIGFSLMRVDAA